MAKIKIYNLSGEEVKETELLSSIFGAEENPTLLAQAVRVQLANGRQPIAHTKTRGEVSGGGRKPHKQKGTGRARAGSTRSPLWIGGGVTFGPRNVQNFKLRINQKMRQAALRMALSQKVSTNRLLILEDLELPKVSTKGAVEVLGKLPIEEGSILLVLPEMNANVELSVANLPYLKVIKAGNINLLDIMKFDYILTTLKGLEKMSANLAGGK